MKKFFSLAFFIISFAHISAFPLPEEFYVNPRWFGATLIFDIEAQQSLVGTVHRKFTSLRTEYDLFDNDGNIEAQAKLRWVDFGAIFDIIDRQKELIGMVEEHSQSFFPTFKIKALNNDVLAIGEMNFWETKYSIVDPLTEEEIATLSRPFIRIKDDWTVTITNPALFLSKQIDSRLFVTLMAFQTDCANWKKRKPTTDPQVSQELTLKMEKLVAEIEKDPIFYFVQPKETDFETVAQAVEAQLQGEKNPQKYLDIIGKMLEQKYFDPLQKKALSYLLQKEN